mmetsp:Transcript_12777/g.21249  ORF Transcript_12777/g.21249 Transcript_12777/m.21249 type:complete len:290 (+) Transcript_12777:1075-1944(+)
MLMSAFRRLPVDFLVGATVIAWRAPFACVFVFSMSAAITAYLVGQQSAVIQVGSSLASIRRGGSARAGEMPRARSCACQRSQRVWLYSTSSDWYSCISVSDMAINSFNCSSSYWSLSSGPVPPPPPPSAPPPPPPSPSSSSPPAAPEPPPAPVLHSFSKFSIISLLSSWALALFRTLNLPASTTSPFRLRLSVARARMRSSTGELVSSRNTRTSFFWPMRCARSCACASIIGFQSLSKMMTVSAVAKLIPKPPARVDSRNKKYGESGRLNCATRRSRSSADVLPSSRKY